MRKNTTAQLAKTMVALSVTSLYVGSLGGCNDDKKDNVSCEHGCIDDYKDELPDCHEKTVECLEGCSGSDDISCLWDCEDHEDNCSMGWVMCLGDCPCQNKSVDCMMDCDMESEDMDCMMGCAEVYSDCAGNNSPYMQANMCMTQASACASICESNEEMDELLDCRKKCNADLLECLENVD
ncbi:MAG: hypothetical protein GY847_29455 [Proteobacteria bacterium]|nr:hypothetical protein [Pseudomonadota bacterium]